MIGGTYFAGGYFAGALRTAAAGLAASASITFTASATISPSPRETQAGITIDGVDVRGRVRMKGVTIHDILNDAPNTCALVVEGTAPAVGQRLRITVNEGAVVLFAGTIQSVDHSFDATPIHVAWHVAAIDDTARANAKRPFGTWTDTSATTIAQAITTTFAPGFTSAGVAAGLPPVTIVFDGSDPFIACLTRLATAVGGYCKVEDGVVYLFIVDPAAPPDPIDAAHPFLFTPAIQSTTDSSQLRTRVYGKGYGEAIQADLTAGETLIPIENGATFPTSGLAIAGTTADGAQSQRLAYTGRELQAGGTLVGPGAGPTTAPLVALVAGAGIESGDHDYAYRFLTATGGTLASPTTRVTLGLGGIVAPPAAGPVVYPGGAYRVAGALDTRSWYGWGYTFWDGGTNETILTPVGSTQLGFEPGIDYNAGAIDIAGGLPTPPAGYQLCWYRTEGGASAPGPIYKRLPFGQAQGQFAERVPAGAQTFLIDVKGDAALGPSALTAISNRTNVTYPAGPTGVTNIELYRTAAGASQLKKLTTIGSNTAGTFLDTVPDASLTTNVPIGDTSGLQQPQGQVNPGSPTLIVASTAPFRAAGGWVVLGGGQVVRYTGITAPNLTGIPATGAGAITTTVLYGSQAIPAPMLTGVTGLALPVKKGTAIHIWVQRDDLAAQAAHAARTGGDGIVEYLFVDLRRGLDSLVARCDAELALFARPLVTVTYATRDVKTKSGKTVAIDLVSPAIHATLTIQDVTITEIDQVPHTAPRFTVQASSVRFSLEDTLRRLIAGGLIVGGST